MKRIIERIKNTIKEKKGESIAETLVAMLITVLALTLLPGAIVAAARVNQRAESQTTYVDRTKSTVISSGSLILDTGEIGDGGKIVVNKSIKEYTEETGGKSIYYYE